MSDRILIVDDTLANLHSLAAILKEKGYQISVAGATRPTRIRFTSVSPEHKAWVQQTAAWLASASAAKC